MGEVSDLADHEDQDYDYEKFNHTAPARLVAESVRTVPVPSFAGAVSAQTRADAAALAFTAATTAAAEAFTVVTVIAFVETPTDGVPAEAAPVKFALLIAATTPVPSLPPALAGVPTNAAAAESAATAADTCAAVEVTTDEPLVARLTVMSLSATVTASAAEAVPGLTYVTEIELPAAPGSTAVYTRSLLVPATAVVNAALVLVTEYATVTLLPPVPGVLAIYVMSLLAPAIEVVSVARLPSP